ncbi:hypothetical protein CR513_50144, partial [Mucuna pruriens]
MTILDGYWLCSLLTRMSLLRSSLYFANIFKMKKVLILLLSKVMMGENLKMKTFNNSVENMEFIITFPIQELLNRMDNLGKFDPKFDKGVFIGYSTKSKAYRVYNSRTLKVKESIHVKFNDSKLDKELSELIEPFVELNIKELQTAFKELLLDYEPKTHKVETSSRNWQMKPYHLEEQIL